jgi:hypothetical protein
MGMPPGIPPGGGGGAGAPPGPQLATVLGALSGKQQNPGADFAKQSAELQGADPTMVLRQLKQIGDALSVLFVKSYQTVPKGAGGISDTMKQLAKAVKHFEDAANVQSVVGEGGGDGPQPISFGPAMTGQPQGNTGQPSQ